jgi:hypothetical protein
MIRKLTADYTKEAKANKKYIKTLLGRSSITTVTKGSQTELVETVNEDYVEKLIASINDVYRAKSVRKALLPLTAAEDELIIATRTRSKRTSETEEVIRDTVGLRGKEGTHVNCGVQVGTIGPQMRYLVENIQTKTLSITRKDSLIALLNDELRLVRKAEQDAMQMVQSIE